MSYSDNPTSYRTGSMLGNGGNVSGGVWDDSERSEDSTSHLGIIVEENDREYSVYDVPLDGSSRGIPGMTGMTATTTDSNHVFRDNGVSSLPHVEEFKATAITSSKGSRSSSRFRKVVRGRRKLYIAGVVLVLVLLVLLISIPTSKRNHKSTSSNDSKGSFTFATRNSTKEDVFQFLKHQNIYLDITPIEQTAETPQHQAAVWLSREDKANLKVPKKDADEQTIYRYLVRYILAVCYYSLDGPNHWRNKLGFLNPSNVCKWHTPIIYGKRFEEAGVFCENSNSGIPDQLLLFSNNLYGSIPTEIGLLTSLTRLDFSSNELLTGSIPTNLCQLRQLQKLDLSWNVMTGNIPPCIGTNMTSLQWLYLAGNAFHGTIPSHLGLMTQLQRFIVEDNMFTGNPISIWNSMSQLQVLFASQNNFTGFIDSNFFPRGHKTIEIIDVSQNQFTYQTTASNDAFPHHLLQLFNLTHLDLSNNPLQGTFPHPLFPRKAINHELVYFSMYNTKMNGTFPNLQQLVTIKHLDFAKNNFHGALPSYLGTNNTNLELLYLSENAHFFLGTIPSTFVHLTKLRDLSLRNTKLQGAIPSFIGSSLTNLVLLDLGLNNLTNTVPSSLGNLKKLEYLLLNGNLHLAGGLHPVTAANHPHLKVLLIDRTDITLKSINCEFTVSGTMNVTLALKVYTDCVRPTVPPCECCKCCRDADGFGCSKALLANVDASWLQTFDRTSYTVIEDDGHG